MQIHTLDWRVELLRQQGYRFVMIGHCDDNTGLSFTDLDVATAVKMSFEYLHHMGHRRIGFLGHTTMLRQSGYGPAVRSWDGYQQTLQTYPISAYYREVRFDGKDVFNSTLELLDEVSDLTVHWNTQHFSLECEFVDG